MGRAFMADRQSAPCTPTSLGHRGTGEEITLSQPEGGEGLEGGRRRGEPNQKNPHVCAVKVKAAMQEGASCHTRHPMPLDRVFTTAFKSARW